MIDLYVIFITCLISNFFFLFVLSNKRFTFFNKNRLNQIRWGDSNKSHYGGLAFFFSYLISLIILTVYNVDEINKQIIYFFIIITLISFYGYLDEKYIFGAKRKLLFQVVVSYMIIKSGVELNLFYNENINLIFNMIWYLFLFNAFNMVDNIDLGFFSAVFPSMTFFFLISCFHNFPDHIEILATIYFTGIIIFFVFNRYPSKIFLGEIGSAQLTAIVIILSYFFLWKEQQFSNYGTSLFEFLKNNLFFIFIFVDFLIVSARRIYLKKPLYLGDTNHISHQFTKFIPVNYFALYINVLGFASIGVYLYFNDNINIVSWSNILFLLGYYIFILIINITLYLYFLRKDKCSIKNK